MPELPEVETFAADLRPHLVGRRILTAHILWSRTVAEPDSLGLIAGLAGQKIVSVGRRGKFLIFGLDLGDSLVIHLRMTGRLQLVAGESPELAGPHVRAWFELDDGWVLNFTDPRKFGRIWLTNDLSRVVGKLGPEPLAWDFSPETLAERLDQRRGVIKALLLNQEIVAGIGNIYADEALFLAWIHPLRPGASLTSGEIGRLHAAIRQVLGEAIGERGTTLRDYRPPYGQQGAYQNRLRVYQQTDHPCPRCGTPIRRIRVTQRSTHYCPQCQAAGGVAAGSNP